eukprot:5929945-Karenia_brevis.AAC.1
MVVLCCKPVGLSDEVKKEEKMMMSTMTMTMMMLMVTMMMMVVPMGARQMHLKEIGWGVRWQNATMQITDH